MVLIKDYSLQKISISSFDRFFLENEANKTIKKYFEDYISQVKESMINSFTIRNDEVASFFLENDDFILMLPELEQVIRDFFPDEELILEFVPDPDWVGQLVLYIQTPITEANIDDLYSKIEKIENKSRILLNKDIRKKFLIDVE